MSIAVFIEKEKDAERLLPWAIQFAKAAETDLSLVLSIRATEPSWNKVESIGEDSPQLLKILARLADEFTEINLSDFWHKSQVSTANSLADSSKNSTENVSGQLGFNDDQAQPCAVATEANANAGAEQVPDEETKSRTSKKRIACQLYLVRGKSVDELVARNLEKLGVSLLLLRASDELVSSNAQDLTAWRLFAEVSCESALLRGQLPNNDSFRVLIATTVHEDETKIALTRSQQLARSLNGSTSLALIRPNNAALARDVAQWELEKTLRQTVKDRSELTTRIVLADTLAQGVSQLKSDGFALFVIPTERPSKIRSFFRVLDQKSQEGKPVAGMAIRGSIPLRTRLTAQCTAWLRSHIPQLDRERRLELISQVTSGSKANFDFMALIFLSTLIASFGLISDSTAVVIGAMLVAPLMSPLIGTGFGLVQSNSVLMLSALRTVAWGFALSFVSAFCAGLVCALFKDFDVAAGEFKSRETPGLIDVGVALASGAAAAYAIGRPTLSGALPGVAIAAALIPPLATSGIALSRFALLPASGAMLMFLLNIVGIILASAAVFFLTGLHAPDAKRKSEQKDQRVWPLYAFWIFAVTTVILAWAVNRFTALGTPT